MQRADLRGRQPGHGGHVVEIRPVVHDLDGMHLGRARARPRALQGVGDEPRDVVPGAETDDRHASRADDDVRRHQPLAQRGRDGVRSLGAIGRVVELEVHVEGAVAVRVDLHRGDARSSPSRSSALRTVFAMSTAFGVSPCTQMVEMSLPRASDRACSAHASGS